MKAYKIVFNIVLVLVALLVIFFFSFTESYKLSLEAKVKYGVGDYKEARRLAKEAFDLDPYNKMAVSILAQSKISTVLKDYLDDSKKYLKEIDRLTKKSDFSDASKIKIKMMCEVMIGRYKKLNPTIMTDKDLYEECTTYYNKYQKIYKEL
jgi:tetratricopeptide (TPR) repeat protein